MKATLSRVLEPTGDGRRATGVETGDASGGLLLCCPVCGRVRLLLSASQGGSDEEVEWECRSCGATGLMSSLRPGGAAVVLSGLPGSSSLRPPARPVGECYVPWVRPVEDSWGAWSEAGSGSPVRLVCAASGVGVGTLTCDGAGVWIARAWVGGRAARLVGAEDSTDLVAFLSEGAAGILPAGCYVSSERPPEGWPVGWWG